MAAQGITPGPWRVEHSMRPIPGVGQQVQITVKAKRGQSLEHVADVFRLPDARAIAALPDLIAALEDAAEFIEHGTPIHPGSHVAEALLAALAKARGEG